MSSSPITLSTPLTWFQKLLWLSGCVLFFVVLYLIHQQFQATQIGSRLDESLHNTDQLSPGWRLKSLEAAREAIPDDENSAYLIQRACQYLPQEWPPPMLNRLVNVNSCTPEALAPWECTLLTTERDLHIEGLAEARELVNWPRGRHPIPLDSVAWNRSMGQTQQVSQIVLLLLCDAFLQSEAGDLEGAANSCRAALNAVRSLGDEPYLLTQMVRRFQAAIVCRGVQFLINHGVAEPEMLADWQQRLERESQHPAFAIAARSHRALLQELLESIESGKLPLNQAVSSLCPDNHALWGLPTLDDFRQEHAALMPALARLVAAAEKPPPQRGQFLRELNADLAGQSFKLLGLLMRDMPNVEGRFTAREALLRCTIAALAAERYRNLQGHWPKALSDLTPTFLAEAPLDPSDGEPLRYQRLADGIAIYSLCRDDRLHQYHASEAWLAHRGVGVRLWDVPERGRQRALPMPEVRWP